KSSKRIELVEKSSKKAEVMEESSKKAKAEIAQESSSRRAGEELEQESSKKQKVEEDKESKELKQCLEINLYDGDDVTIDATHLSTKSPMIMYLTFGKLLKNFDREDLEVLWSIVKARFKKTELVNYLDNFLLLNLKTMFVHHVEDSVWKNQQGLVTVLNWKLYDSCRVHCITMQSILYYLLVEKMYPLTNHTLHQMFNDVKLQVDYECEMAFELLRLVKKQLKEGCDDDTFRDRNHESGNHLNFPIFSATNEFSSISKQDVELRRIRKKMVTMGIFLILATKSILDELLDEFKDEIVNVTMVNEEADPNPTRDIEELE
ncbi:hypothetical protein Tco_0718790, partial [Tanacetum coccineum]